MKQVTKQRLKDYRDPSYVLPKVDYSMNTCYFRVVDGGEVLGASVDPRIAVKYMTATSEMMEVTL